MIDWYAEQSDKFIGTTAAIIMAASAAASAGASVYGAKKQAGAATDAAKLQTDAANHSADLQDAAAKRAELYARQQAETGWQSNEHTQKANYDQWAQTQHAIMDTLGSQLGIKYAMPDYTPGVDPHYLDSAGPMPTSTSAGPTSTAGPTAPSTTPGPAGPAPSVDPSKGDLAGQISAYFKSRGVSDQETPYWVGKWSELDARGKELNDPSYANKRLAAADVFGGQSKTTAPATASPTLATFASPNFMKFQPAMALPMAYQPNTLGAYVGR